MDVVSLGMAGLGVAVVGVLTVAITLVWTKIADRRKVQLHQEVSDYLKGYNR